MEEIKLSDDVIEQIKSFDHDELTGKQELLIDKLILNEELKKRYKDYGLCKECKQTYTGYSGFSPGYSGYNWCQPCYSCYTKCFQQNFKNWTSGNREIDWFIQKTQLKAKNKYQFMEWIEYGRFEDIKYLAKGGFG